MSIFYREVKASYYIKENKIELDKPLVIYSGDFNIKIRFNLIQYAYKFDKNGISLLEDLSGAYCNITLVNPLGIQIDVEDVEIVDDVVDFIITKEMADEIEEVGTYKMQMHIGNEKGDTDTSSFSLPPFSFKVEERLTGIVINGMHDSEGYMLTDLDGYSLDNNSTKKIIGYPADRITSILSKADDTNLYTLTIDDTVTLANRNYQFLKVTRNCALKLPTITDYKNIELNIKMAGDYSITFPIEIEWQTGTDFSKIGNGVEFTVMITYVYGWQNASWKGGIIYYA